MSQLAKEILLKTPVPTVTWTQKPKTLYELCNVQRSKAYLYRVMPEQWYKKGLSGCFYEVHKVKYRPYIDKPVHGKAWGIKYWNHEPVDTQPKEIKGGLKFSWRPYRDPHTDGVVYDPETASQVQKRRTRLIQAFNEQNKI